MNFWILHALAIMLACFFVHVRYEPRAPMLSIGWFYLVFYSVFMVFSPKTPAPFIMEPYVKLASAQVLLQAWLLATTMNRIEPQKMLAVLHTIGGFLIFDAAYLLLGGKGFMTGATFDTAVMAVFMPVWVAHYASVRPRQQVFRVVGALVTGVAIAVHGESTAFIVLILQALLALVRLRSAAFLFLAIFLGVMAHIKLGDTFLKSDGRLFMWANYMDYWLEKANLFIGFGPGAFEWLGPQIPLTEEKLRYIWMHNDWLQILFEAGFIGFILAIAFFVELLWVTRKTWHMQAIVLSFGTCMLFYSPLHFLFMQVFMWIIVGIAYGESNE